MWSLTCCMTFKMTSLHLIKGELYVRGHLSWGVRVTTIYMYLYMTLSSVKSQALRTFCISPECKVWCLEINGAAAVLHVTRGHTHTLCGLNLDAPRAYLNLNCCVIYKSYTCHKMSLYLTFNRASFLTSWTQGSAHHHNWILAARSMLMQTGTPPSGYGVPPTGRLITPDWKVIPPDCRVIIVNERA